MKKKIVFTLLVYLYFLFISFIALYFKLSYLPFIIIYTGAPIIFLLFNLKKYRQKIFIISAVIALPFVFMMDHAAHLSKSWYEHGTTNIRVLGTFPIDSFIWGILYALIIISVYLYLFDKSKREVINKNIRNLVKLTILLLIISGSIFVIFSKNLFIPYFYLILLILVSIWATFLLIKYPKLFNRMNLLGFWFFFPSLLYELVAVKLHQWEFQKGYHIGYVDLFNITFPFEELLWFYIIVVALGSIYEVYTDNKK